jgi:hypothetical protein
MLDPHFNKLISVGNKGLRQQKIYRCSKGRNNEHETWNSRNFDR